MWKQAKVTIGDVLAEQAMVDFEGKTRAAYLEWPTPIPANAEIKVGEETFFAGDCRACAGKFHIDLMRERFVPEPLPKHGPPVPEPESTRRKGTKP